MFPQQISHYRQLRSQGLPARHALACSRERLALASRCEAAGFEWRENRHGLLYAAWQASGFDLRAALVNDDDGWWTQGVECVGRFSCSWKPGAIRHRQGDRNACEWFVPANLSDPKAEYRRACAYGHDWWYVGLVVKASRAGVVLGDADLYGIEFECGGGQEYLTAMAFELADQAIREANQTLQTLCGCH